MKELSKLQLCVYNIGGLLLVAGIIVPLFSGATAVALYLYLLGALMFSSMQVLQKYEGKNITLKRLRRQQILGALMLLLAGGLMACSVYGIPPLCKGEWQSEPFWRSTLHLEYRLNWHAKNGETLTYKSD